ncbi:MAG: hypothetical protein RL609_537, partial [Bacteroidota bacterium]
FPLGDLEIGKFILDMGLSQDTIEWMYHRSALEWLNMKKEDFE